jgi:prepilin-type N-terminal cleavage/methylation domain-containing protein
MVKTMRKANVAGFSLVELMVVVAIIGILSAIAIPNFQRFQRKARQAESASMQSAVRTGLETFNSEWTTYTTDLVATGFRVSGTFETHVQSGIAGFVMPANLYTGSTAINNANFSTAVAAVQAGANQGARVCAPAAPAQTTRTTYQITSCSNLGGAQNDEWLLNSLGVRTSTRDGVP